MNNRGSITIFFSMNLLVVLSVISVSFETVRYYCASAVLAMVADSVSDSVSSSYDRLLWEEYGLVLYPSQEILADMAEEYAGCYLENNSFEDVWGIKNISVENEPTYDVEKITEQDFLTHVSKLMSYQSNDNTLTKNKEDILSFISCGEECERKMVDYDIAVGEIFGEALSINPKTYFDAGQGIIKMEELSSGVLDLAEDIKVYDESDIDNLHQYINLFLNCYLDSDVKQTVMKCEQEYVLCGKTTDKENFEETIDLLIRLRLGANYKSICENQQNISEIHKMLLEKNFESINDENMEEIITILWTYAESFNDVYNLLKGKKVPVYKTFNEWNLDIEEVIDGKWTKACKGEGIDYQGYLQILFNLCEPRSICVRVMDIIDVNMRTVEDDFKAADCLKGYKLKIEFQVEKRFLGLTGMKNIYDSVLEPYKIVKTVESYY